MMYKCSHCGGISTAEDINNCTMDTYCLNRKQRREYVPIEKLRWVILDGINAHHVVKI